MTIDGDVNDSHSEVVVGMLRMLQDIHHTGRAVLTVLYLCVLSLCFLVPFFFYIRMHCDDRRNRQLRELEIATITQSLTESHSVQREEARATRRKYREERRARILQLFGPVRVILKEENFVCVKAKTSECTIPKPLDVEDDNNENIDIDLEVASGGVERERTDQGEGDCGEEDSYILLPVPGLPSGALLDFLMSGSNSYNNLQASNHSSSKHRMPTKQTLRQVSIECSICLCEYTVGSDVVWSSNPQCEHVFHKSCIEQWLMKQREGPLCPCCRRDFVIDPFDDAEALIETLPTDITEESGIGVDVTIQRIDSDDISDQQTESTNDIEQERTSNSRRT